MIKRNYAQLMKRAHRESADRRRIASMLAEKTEKSSGEEKKNVC